MKAVDFQELGRLPAPGDNAAIAVKRLEAGTKFAFKDRVHTLSHSMLEGHRFATEPIPQGEALRSWGLPFGKALRAIQPGEYLCNAGILEALKLRNLDFTLPAHANFADQLRTYDLDEKAFRPGAQVSFHPQQGTFHGYARPAGRGIGTRNVIVILGTTSLTASIARALESRLRPAAHGHENIDGIVAVTHTEGGGNRRPNNLEFVLRALAGFMVHPNIGAVLALDYGTEVFSNAMLEKYLRDHDYPIDHVLHRFYSIKNNFGAALEEGEKIVRGWLAPVNSMRRTAQPLAGLRVALQCGGSDAFSGVSGNPLAGWAAKELIRHGGSANLAETDELIGAEPYVLANIRDLATARRFLEKIEIFKERAAWHGHSAEGNPSGGNKFRGLYNIAIKSIGAARKKDPDVRLDYVIDYGQRMAEPGYYFMDSPGNDLESIAGQVAAGCNLIYFITGNGSITNFPFVPTVKFITTTARWNLLSRDMDVNAGRYQDGTPMEELGAESFDYTVKVASGMRSVGERAGHSQVSIWRDWRQTDASHLEELRARPKADGRPIPIPRAGAPGTRFRFLALPARRGYAIDQVGLIVPTSLCSGQIARGIADDLNTRGFASGRNVSRFITLVHTEGCGSSGGENEEHYTRTLVGHLVHPFVKQALLLEHGCERTHNDLFRHVLEEHGINADRFGYASIQLDGGIGKVVDKVERWFMTKLSEGPAAERRAVGLEALSLGLLSVGEVSEPAAQALVRIAKLVAGSGGTLIIPENASLLASPGVLEEMGWPEAPRPSLDYGQVADRPGLHVMATPTDHAVEMLTGLGGTGAQLILAHLDGPPLQGHPMIPVLQVATRTRSQSRLHEDLDRVIDPRIGPERIAEELLDLLCDTASWAYQPRLWAAGNTDFQVTRGMLGVSL
ncbi:MAG: UxaA family hydrolase [Gammaproteobacteria bacterium]|nr:UxaA family hydrolase [Gammaproteobacteria bacterium]